MIAFGLTTAAMALVLTNYIEGRLPLRLFCLGAGFISLGFLTAITERLLTYAAT